MYIKIVYNITWNNRIERRRNRMPVNKVSKGNSIFSFCLLKPIGNECEGDITSQRAQVSDTSLKFSIRYGFQASGFRVQASGIGLQASGSGQRATVFGLRSSPHWQPNDLWLFKELNCAALLRTTTNTNTLDTMSITPRRWLQKKTSYI